MNLSKLFYVNRNQSRLAKRTSVRSPPHLLFNISEPSAVLVREPWWKEKFWIHSCFNDHEWVFSWWLTVAASSGQYFSKIQFSELSEKPSGYCTKYLRKSSERCDYTFSRCAESQTRCKWHATSEIDSTARIKDIIVNNCTNFRRTQKCESRIKTDGGLLLHRWLLLEKPYLGLLFVNLTRALLSIQVSSIFIERCFGDAEHL